MTDEKVIYEAPTPPYVVQEKRTNLLYEPDSSVATLEEKWESVKGFQAPEHATAYADQEKRRNPATDYRVVKSQSEEDR